MNICVYHLLPTGDSDCKQIVITRVLLWEKKIFEKILNDILFWFSENVFLFSLE